MKASIITLHYINHYGSVLQTYATCRVFEKAGIEAEIIDYIRPNAKESEFIENALKVKNISKYSLKGLLYSIVKRIEAERIRRVCNVFRKTNIPLTRFYGSYKELCADPPVADIYCTGSDQTWNSVYNGGLLPAYYLRFAPKNKTKIGYAVSIGMDRFPPEEEIRAKKYINEYSAISVRENSAIPTLCDLGYNCVIQVVDPTLMLCRKEWEPFISKKLVREKYILIYKLNNLPEMEDFAEKLSKKTGCRIVRVSYYLFHMKNRGKMFWSPPVEDFLSLIDNAEYVITDSFHGLAFSLNFHKEFYAFMPGQYSSRLTSILSLTGTESRLVKNIDKYDTTPIDYEKVDTVLEKERKKALRYIVTSQPRTAAK